MKISTLMTSIVLILSLHVPSALAQQSEHADTGAGADADTPAMPMRQHMEEMQALMEKMAETDDPAERRQLMQEHRQKMRESMNMMHDMHGMMGQGRGRGMRHHSEHEAMMGLTEAYRQMDKRLDLIQTLLEQLLKQED